LEVADWKNENHHESPKMSQRSCASLFLTASFDPAWRLAVTLGSGIAGRFLILGPAVTVEVLAATRPTPPGPSPSLILFR